MVYTPLRYGIEIVVQLLAAFIAGYLAYQGLFSDQEQGVLLAVVAGVVMLLLVQGLYSFRNTFITAVRIVRRYGVELSMNEVSFLRRSGDSGQAVVKNAQFPEGIVISNVDRRDWSLRDWEGRQELARI